MTNATRRYAILGTGALGGFYGARLQRSGIDVHFLLRSDYHHVCQHGLVIKSIAGDFELPHVHAYQDVAQMPPCDVVVVALKTTQNHLLPQLLPPVLKTDGVVLVLQNGLGVESDVAAIVGDDRVIGGLSFLCSNKIGPGTIHHLDYGSINLGEFRPGYAPGGISDRLLQIAAEFRNAGIEITCTDDLLLGRWKKLVWNIPYNGLSVVLDARTDAIMKNPHSRQLVMDLMAEVVAGAASQNRYISDEFVQTMLTHTDQMKPYLTSMKLDFDSGRPLEVETIVGNPLRVANQAGVALPKIAVLYQQLLFLDARNRHKCVSSL
ncbi:MAG: putative 2-dehydropantoate 2-reductase [Cyanobacteria bacterium]|nr:putative 2-dehydropantoate 2-reductase [Cyanobacteriota bacterium]MDW8201595.1 putative 2-dehydropantoate 2-reductase [Cyanobacteriota bacterium SKYGB_h_bin112]